MQQQVFPKIYCILFVEDQIVVLSFSSYLKNN